MYGTEISCFAFGLERMGSICMKPEPDVRSILHALSCREICEQSSTPLAVQE
jgi:hypothetical protein